MKNNKYIIATITICLLGLVSCTPVAKLVTGVRNPQVYVSNDERLEYYKPFYKEQGTKIDIYTLADPSYFKKAFDSLHVPRIYVQSIKTDSIYVLDCYEDVAANIEDINNKKFDEVTIANKKEFSYFKEFVETKSALTYTENSSKSKDWNVYMINGSFMGKKMRKRSLPISDLNDLNEIIVLDISINKKAESSK